MGGRLETRRHAGHRTAEPRFRAISHSSAFYPARMRWLGSMHCPARGLVGAVLVTAATCACAGRWHTDLPVPPSGSDTSVRLHDHSLTIHLIAGRDHQSPLILYATGDAGWWGKDKATFTRL